MALVAHTLLYICFVSVVTDMLNTWSDRLPAWDAFWGGVSPYAMLYTSGKCLARLRGCGTPCLCVCALYVIARVRWTDANCQQRVWANVDFVANRVVVQAIQASYAGSYSSSAGLTQRESVVE